VQTGTWGTRPAVHRSNLHDAPGNGCPISCVLLLSKELARHSMSSHILKTNATLASILLLLSWPGLFRSASSWSAASSVFGVGSVLGPRAVQSGASSAQMQFVPEPAPGRPNGPPPTPLPPGAVGSVGAIAPPGEPGEPLVVSGHVFAPDGVTIKTRLPHIKPKQPPAEPPYSRCFRRI
jgi:hypothetical protein